MRRGSVLAVVVAAGLLLASACASGPAGESSALGAASADTPFEVSGTPVRTTTVELPKSYKYDPAVIEVKAGDVVTWTNNDDFPHTVRLRDGSDVNRQLGVGNNTSIRFDSPGVHSYDCALHPTQMKGKVIVRDDLR
jgi:plastocyanin